MILEQKMENSPIATISEESITSKIYLIRGIKVMLDEDLAELYGVKTGRLNEQVKRNILRFPNDFMFQLSKSEFEILISRFAISRWGGRRKMPYVFTEQGVAMLSSVLNSKRAIQVNIAIMRTFTKLREMISSHKELRQKIESMEKKYDKQFQVVFAAIKDIFDQFRDSKEADKNKEPIGFRVSQKL